MRILIALLLAASAAVPAVAQSDRTAQRVEKLEQEIRALQRRVFQGGTTVQPEIGPAVRPSALPGDAATSPVADLAARLDAMERQLASITGQAEQNGNRLREIEDSMARFQAAYNRDQAERAAAVAAPQPRPATPLPTEIAANDAVASPATPSRSASDPAEDAYNAGFRLWEQKRYTEAQAALEAMAKRYPSHRLASWSHNLAGRAYLDEGKPATAAKIFLDNYQGNPRGERAADSLYFLGQSLAQLDKRVEACKVYDELQVVYGTAMRDYLKQRLPKARTDARCS
jgi:TolA-binding protein